MPVIKYKHSNMQRKGRGYTLEEVLPYVAPKFNGVHGNTRKDYDGDIINVSSSRLQQFIRSIECCKCGLQGKLFYKEKARKDTHYHLGLYGTSSDGEEVLMTRLHITPLSQDGSDDVGNAQTVCFLCR